MEGSPIGPREGRYAGRPVHRHVGADGREVVYLARRFVPQPEQLTLLREHVVHDGERLDTIAALHLGDPLLSWRLCDANRALDPAELTAEPGQRLLVTLPAELSWAGSGH